MQQSCYIIPHRIIISVRSGLLSVWDISSAPARLCNLFGLLFGEAIIIRRRRRRPGSRCRPAELKREMNVFSAVLLVVMHGEKGVRYPGKWVRKGWGGGGGDAHY